MPYSDSLNSKLNDLSTTAGNAVADLSGVQAGADVLASQFTDVKNALQDLQDFVNEFKGGYYYTPTGAVVPFAGTDSDKPPAGWLVCNGASFVSAGLSAGMPLYDLLVAAGWGAVPDLRGRTIIGVGTGVEITGVLGTVQGVKEVTLTSAQSGLPAHSHGITDPGHGHTNRAASGTYGVNNSNDGFIRAINIQDGGFANTNGNTTGITINNNTAANASSAHTNIQPSIPLNYIIKT